jgi:signal transduction histidine kinase
MAAAVAHEINNPLESLINLIFLARQYSAEESRVYKLLVTAEQELERVAHIARQTLGYYKDSGSPTEVHIHDLVENVLTVSNAKLVAANIAVERQFTDLRKIVVSKGEMIQVFSNVIANAIDAMSRGGTLYVSARKLLSGSDGGIQVVVRDTGVGIDSENMARVFEPFFTTKASVGTGIGLWVAKQLVERRGGRIAITSSTSDQASGTSVTIFIPFARRMMPVGMPDERILIP